MPLTMQGESPDIWPLQVFLYQSLCAYDDLTEILPQGTEHIFDAVPPDAPNPFVMMRLSSARRIETKTDHILEVEAVISITAEKDDIETLQRLADCLIRFSPDVQTLNEGRIIDFKFTQSRSEFLKNLSARRTNLRFKILYEA